MRVAFISDLHASLDALDAVLADIAERGVERVVCLGDIVDLGPEPGATLERLQQLGIPCIQGNHDTLDEHPPIPRLAEVEDWTRDQLSAEQLAWLGALPVEHLEDLDGLRVLCVHASPRSVGDQVLSDTPFETLSAWWGDRAFDVMVCGHTHVPLLRRLNDRLVVNVGSVGQPFRWAFAGGPPPAVLPWSEYAIVGHVAGRVSVEHCRIPFDLEAFTRALRASTFPGGDAWLEQWARRQPLP